MLNKEPEWQKHEQLIDASVEFEGTLNPFDGPAAVAALAKIIKVSDAVKAASHGEISTEERASYVLGFVSDAQEAAGDVLDVPYSEIFYTQKLGLESIIKLQQARQTPAARTDTTDKNMSDRKS